MLYTFTFYDGPKDGQTIEMNYIPIEVSVGNSVYILNDNKLIYNGEITV